MSNYIERYWRDAKPEDAIKEPPIVARFRDEDTTDWGQPRALRGLNREGDLRWSSGTCFWKFCQVYDAPNPGEGWRLIDIDKETKQDGDEYLAETGNWCKAGMGSGFRCMLDYRRRITPAVTYVPFTWEDREQLRGRWIKFKHPGSAEFLISKLYNSDKHGLVANDYSASSLLDEAIFLDTGKPVGKKVTQ